MRNNEECASGNHRIIGYMRVSTKKQKLALQKELLKKAGCEVIYSDLGVSGKIYPRKGLTKALRSLKSGDQLIVYKLARPPRHVLRAALLLQYFKDKDIHFSSLTEAFDIQTPDGRFMYYFCSIMAEAESDRTGMRTKDGMRSRKAKGVKFGRKRKMSNDAVISAIKMLKAPDTSKAAVARYYDISPSTLNRNIENLAARRNG